jgi:hypothetical protein
MDVVNESAAVDVVTGSADPGRPRPWPVRACRAVGTAPPVTPAR